MTGPFSIRRYRPTDATRVRELHEAAMRSVGALADGITEPDLEDVEGAYFDAGGDFLVGERDGDVIAIGGFRPVDGHLRRLLPDVSAMTAEFKRMRVDPDHHREGYGTRLLAALEARATDAEFETAVLDTTAGQTGARRLAERHGFECVRRETVSPGDEPFELLVYQKQLAD